MVRFYLQNTYVYFVQADDVLLDEDVTVSESPLPGGEYNFAYWA